MVTLTYPRLRAASTRATIEWWPSEALVWQGGAPGLSAGALGGDARGQPPLERRLDRPCVLPEFGRDARQSDGRVDFLLGGARDTPAGGLLEDTVLGDLEPLPHRHVAQADVVGLGPAEVLEGGAEALGRDDPEVHPNPLPVTDRRLGLPLLQHLGDLGQRHEGLHHLSG